MFYTMFLKKKRIFLLDDLTLIIGRCFCFLKMVVKHLAWSFDIDLSYFEEEKVLILIDASFRNKGTPFGISNRSDMIG